MQDEDGANTAEGREGQGDRMDEDEDMPVPEPGPESEIFRPIWHDAVPFNRDGTPARHPLLSVPGLPRQHSEIHRMAQTPVVDSADIRLDPIKYGAIDAWKALSNNKYWERRWWMM